MKGAGQWSTYRKGKWSFSEAKEWTPKPWMLAMHCPLGNARDRWVLREVSKSIHGGSRFGFLFSIGSMESIRCYDRSWCNGRAWGCFSAWDITDYICASNSAIAQQSRSYWVWKIIPEACYFRESYLTTPRNLELSSARNRYDEDNALSVDAVSSLFDSFQCIIS